MSDSGTTERSRTDWKRVRAMSDDEIDSSDIPELSEEFFKRAQRRGPMMVDVTIAVDAGVFAWFQSQGDDWQHHIRAAMREYARSHIADDESTT